MKVFLKRVLPACIVDVLIQFRLDFLDGYSAKSYSQEGEDMILRRIFEDKTSGFYVDVGAHHPRRFSNTYYFYQRGWSGINIDAKPGGMQLFSKIRPRDINLEFAIANSKREVTFFMFNEPALNSLDENLSRARAKGLYQIVNEQQMFTTTLAEILRQYLPHGQVIDFLSVDVEGFDFEVLQSNDWGLFRPKYILVECAGQSVDELKRSEVYQYLGESSYAFFAKTLNTVIFREGSL